MRTSFARRSPSSRSSATAAPPPLRSPRVGVKQPYLFRLFPDKKAIFVAALVRSAEGTRLACEEAADGVEGGEQARQMMADACAQLISTRPETLLVQRQGYVAVAASEVQGDGLIGEVVRAGWMSIWETVHLSLGALMTRPQASSPAACSATRSRPPGFQWVPGGEGVFWAAMRQCTPAASSRVVTVGATSPVRLSA
ncbi:hypothetical protein [Streptomyces spongiae]|uniref:hypothetical protein n=1 Tax=Streptomyces spongiae TaxID=565072 RepID=UPI002AD5A7BF|nr:hypothetical protein [Streptomyces spongiae]